MKDKKKILFVVQRYGAEVNGGAEMHCRWIAEHLKDIFDIEVLTTRALDYITWKNHYRKKREIINGVKVSRYSVDRERHPVKFGLIQNKIFWEEHTREDELKWVYENGPRSSRLLKAIERKGREADVLLFWCYRYWHTFHGLNIYPGKSIVVPTAERDRLIDLPLFGEELRKPSGFIFLTDEEKELVQTSSGSNRTPSIISACGIEKIDTSGKKSGAKKLKIEKPYLLYVGRVDRNKGCRQMFDYFRLFRKRTGSNVKLALIGKQAMDIPEDDYIIHLGFLPEEEKVAALLGAELLIMPSFFESLSIVLLEAWAYGCPTLANGLCDVLKGQTKRSNAGLYYENYMEFEEGLKLLLGSKDLRMKLGKSGKNFINKYYTWKRIRKEYSDFINKVSDNSVSTKSGAA